MNQEAGHRDAVSWEAIGLAAVAALRFLLPHAPDRIFDLDPASAPAAYAATGPGGAAFLDAVMLGIAAFALWREASRRGLDPWLLALGLLPLPVLLVHGSGDLLQAWRGADWFAASITAVALAHLVRSAGNRRAVLSIVVGAVAVSGVRGAFQVFWEHPGTVAYFEANREAILAARGWTVDSPEALSFERRLRQPEATGWTGFSNVFSGLSGAAAVALVGIIASRRLDRVVAPGVPPEGAGGPVALGLVAIGLAMLVGVNGSKGAIAATFLGVAVLLLVLGPARGSVERRPGTPILVATALVVAAVVLRGLLGESFADERSLLFRWHYLQGAIGAFVSAPWTGVGPDGFQAAYLATKPATSPENVASAHSLVLDWVASLGVLGLAWVTLVFVMTGRRSVVPAESGPAPSTSRLPLLVVSFLVVGVVCYEQWRTEWPLDETALAIRVGALSIGVLVGTACWGATACLRPSTVRVVAIAAATVVVAHAGIEMLFWQPGSIAISWAIVAVAGAATERTIPESRPAAWSRIASLTVAGTAVLAAVVSIQARLHEDRSLAAVEDLHVGHAAGEPVDPGTRLAAARELRKAIDDHGWWDPRLPPGAIEQFLRSETEIGRSEAFELADAWYDRRPGPRSAGLRAAVRWSDPGGEPASRLVAIEDALAFDPMNPRSQLRKAELLLELGRADEARSAALRARELDQARRFDPLVQFGEDDRARIEAVIEASGPDAAD